MNTILKPKLRAGAMIAAITFAVAGCAKTGASNRATDAGARGAAPARSDLSTTTPPQNAEDKAPRINVEEAKKLLAEGKAIFIDVRGDESYKAAHIKGALNVPLHKLEAGDFKDVPKDKRVIAYCS